MSIKTKKTFVSEDQIYHCENGQLEYEISFLVQSSQPVSETIKKPEQSQLRLLRNCLRCNEQIQLPRSYAYMSELLDIDIQFSVPAIPWEKCTHGQLCMYNEIYSRHPLERGKGREGKVTLQGSLIIAVAGETPCNLKLTKCHFSKTKCYSNCLAPTNTHLWIFTILIH